MSTTSHRVHERLANYSERNWLRLDETPVLSQVKDFVMHDSYLEPYHRRRDELSVDQNCVLWGLRVIIAERHQSALMQQLHEVH